MSTPTDANEAVVRRMYHEVLNKRNPAAVDELFAPDLIGYRSGRAGLRGAESMKRFLPVLEATFGPARWEINDLIAAGDAVVTRWTGHGIHAGTLLGVPATGNAVTVTGITIHRIVDGKIAELWAEEDWLGVLRQIGATTVPPASSAPSPPQPIAR